MSKIDEKAYRQSLERMSAIFEDMVTHADQVSQQRCPYRDRHDHCTAKFSCRNQEKAAEAEKPIGCAHDGHFDYRDAWESDPESLDRAKRKLARIKDDAASRRLRDRPKRG